VAAQPSAGADAARRCEGKTVSHRDDGIGFDAREAKAYQGRTAAHAGDAEGGGSCV